MEKSVLSRVLGFPKQVVIRNPHVQTPNLRNWRKEQLVHELFQTGLVFALLLWPQSCYREMQLRSQPWFLNYRSDKEVSWISSSYH